MTTVATRARTISDLEGFDVVITKDGKPVDVTKNGVLTGYPFEKAAKHSMTVSEWKVRFETNHPGFSANVLKGNGTLARGQTTLRTVRESYEED